MQLIQYNSSAVFVGPAAATGAHTAANILPLYGVQSATFDFGEPLTDVEGLEGSFERIHAAPNEVNLSLGYLVRDAANEENMGMVVDGTTAVFSDLWEDERNYFVATRNDKLDIHLYSGYDSTVVAFGQGCLTSYGINGAVGEPLKANVSLSFLNIGASLSGSGADLPVVNKANGTSMPLAYALPFVGDHNTPFYSIGPGDMTLRIPEEASFLTVVSGVNACLVQSFDLNVALPRQIDRPIGYIYPRSRPLDPPIEARLSVNAFVLKDKAGALNDRLCNNSGQNIELIIVPRCSGESLADHVFTGDGIGIDWTNDTLSFLFTGDGIGIDWANDDYSYLYAGRTDSLRFTLAGARLDSSSVNLEIGNYQHVTFNWSSKIFKQNSTGVNFGNLFIYGPNS